MIWCSTHWTYWEETWCEDSLGHNDKAPISYVPVAWVTPLLLINTIRLKIIEANELLCGVNRGCCKLNCGTHSQISSSHWSNRHTDKINSTNQYVIVEFLSLWHYLTLAPFCLHLQTMLSLDAQHTLRDMKPEHRSPEQLHQACGTLCFSSFAHAWCMHICTHSYMHMHACTHTHTHIYICMHPYAHMHTRPFCFCILLLKFFLHEWNLWSWSKEINKLSDSQIICRHLRDSSWDLKGKVAGTLFTGERVFNGGSWIPLDIIFFCWHLMYNNYFFSVDYYKICEYFIFKLSIKV